MSYSRFPPANVGICISTLFAEPWGVAGEELERGLRLCRDAGFREICLGPAHAQAVGLDRLVTLLGEIDARVRVIEAITAWIDGPAEAVREVRQFLELAASLGADTLLAATIAPTVSPQLAREGMAAACELAGEYGIRIALEFIPGTAVPDLATAWELVRHSDARSAGVVIDMLHWQHQPGGPDFDTLRAIPGNRIHGVQVCDSPPGEAPPGEQYLAFAMSARALPGEGVVDIDALLTALDDRGVDPYVAAEVYNAELASHGMDEMARRLRESIDTVFC